MRTLGSEETVSSEPFLFLTVFLSGNGQCVRSFAADCPTPGILSETGPVFPSTSTFPFAMERAGIVNRIDTKMAQAYDQSRGGQDAGGGSL